MLKVFSVYDSKAGAYLNPMIMRSLPEAIRAFSSVCCNPEHEFSKYAEDYTLFHIADWDELTGTLLPLTTPHPLAKAIECSNRHRDYYFAAKDTAA